MEERATGVVLRSRPLTDSSLIVHWLASPCGRIATVAKGARRPKSSFRGKLDLFFLAAFTFHRSRRSDLHTLHELTLQETFPSLRTDLVRLRQAAYAASLIEKTTEVDTPLEPVYSLFHGFLQHLSLHPPHPFRLLGFECKLLVELGLTPLATVPQLSAGATALLRNATTLPWETLDRIKPSPSQLEELQHFLKAFLLDHLGILTPGRPQALHSP